jgi:hypothetical protein
VAWLAATDAAHWADPTALEGSSRSIHQRSAAVADTRRVAVSLPLSSDQIRAAQEIRQQLSYWHEADAALEALARAMPGFACDAALVKVATINTLYGTTSTPFIGWRFTSKASLLISRPGCGLSWSRKSRRCPLRRVRRSAATGLRLEVLPLLSRSGGVSDLRHLGAADGRAALGPTA